MLEKAIENWLISANELGYLPAFVNALMAAGEQVLSVSRHRPLEAGKDIVTRAANGHLRAYQLKGGDIDIRKWRTITGELEDLLRLPVRVGDANAAEPHRSFLVTNGRVVDEVIVAINEWNIRMRGLGYGQLELIQREALLKAFLDMSATLVPVEPLVAKDLFDTYCADGEDVLACERFSEVLWRTSFDRDSPSQSEWTNAITGSVLVGSFVLQPYAQAQNHYAMFEGWTLVAGAISRYCAVHGTKNPLVLKRALEMAWAEADAALERLLDEARASENLLEGAWPGDGGDVYRARATLVLGCLAAHELVRLSEDPKTKVRPEFIGLCDRYHKFLWLWGEGAVPAFMAIAKALECGGKHEEGEGIALLLLDALVNRNGREADVNRALPSPYYSVEEVLLDAIGAADLDKRIPRGEFVGQSWGIIPIVYWLARRGKRAELESRWPAITKIRGKTFEPEGPQEFWKYRTERGVNRYGFFRAPESWARLAEEARARPNSEHVWPQWGARFLLYSLVAPHRWNGAYATLLDLDVQR